MSGLICRAKKVKETSWFVTVCFYWVPECNPQLTCVCGMNAVLVLFAFE